MAGQIKVNTDQVAQIATTIESLNTKLKEELEATKASINSLSSTWTGEAANATREAYESFASNFFQNYYEVIDQYVKFLRVNVEQGYFETESTNVGLADNFR